MSRTSAQSPCATIACSEPPGAVGHTSTLTPSDGPNVSGGTIAYDPWCSSCTLPSRSPSNSHAIGSSL